MISSNGERQSSIASKDENGAYTTYFDAPLHDKDGSDVTHKFVVTGASSYHYTVDDSGALVIITTSLKENPETEPGRLYNSAKALAADGYNPDKK